MKSKYFLSALVALLSCGIAIGHGVERGSIIQAISAKSMKGETKSRIVDSIQERCDLAGFKGVKGETKVRYETIDQGTRDYFFTVALAIELEGQNEAEPIVVEAGQYDISNPAIDTVEIISVNSRLCR